MSVAAAPPTAPPTDGQELFSAAELGETKFRILAAAYRRLSQEGYAALSVREIAKDAGVNHALINYHFRTKDQLVIEVLDAANRRLLARQDAMYEGPGGYARKWAEARRFYESDLASGFVRMQAELWAASFSNPDLREKFLPRLVAWKQRVRDAVGAALAALQDRGVELPVPFSADVIACWISEFWLGMEFGDLLDEPREREQHRLALDGVQRLLEWVDARIEQQPPARARTRRTRSSA
jgi:AcrR family transcriptional regulator